MNFLVFGRKSMLRATSSLLPKTGLFLLVFSSAVLSVATATESIASETVVTAAEASSPMRATMEVFDVVQITKDYELALATAQKQGVAAEQFFWFHDQERQAALAQKIAAITKDFSGSLGVSVISPSGLVLLANDTDFPLMSVLKMPLVYVVALEMQRRGDNLDSLVPCGRSCLNADTYSPMFEQLVSNGFSNVDGIPVRNADGTRLCFPLRLLISYAVGKSDNNACDLLISNYLGGPKNVERALRELGLERTNVASTEGEMGINVELSYKNSASMLDMAKMFALYANDDRLTPEVRQLIDQSMLFNQHGTTRVRAGVALSLERAGLSLEDLRQQGQLEIFDKTGMGGINSKGQRIAVNDLALIRLFGQQWVVAISAKNVKDVQSQSVKEAERVIQHVVAAMFDELLQDR